MKRESIMKKRAIFILSLITLFFASAYIGAKFGQKDSENISMDEPKIKEETNLTTQEFISTSANEVKTTPNTIISLKKYYKECEHIVKDSAEIPEEMVNLTKQELSERYANWNIEEFTKEEVILSKEVSSFCGEHYLVIEESGVVSIYYLDGSGNKTLVQTTDIAFEYLPETDKIILKNGIYVYGKEELNKIREDFES